MITFKQFIGESINDRGLLKAIFVVGMPGAGKSYTVSRLGGIVQPRVVNTDRATEFLSQKLQLQVNHSNWPEFRDRAHHITETALYHYLNGILPLFIDGTSNNMSNLLHRAGILESLGYDLGVVFIKTSLETALERAKDRQRAVDPAFIKAVATEVEENYAFLRSKFKFCKSIRNDVGELTNEVLQLAHKQVVGFFSEKPSNPLGNKIIEKLEQQKQKYLVPTVLTEIQLRKKLAGWYSN